MAYARRLAVDTATLTQSIAIIDGTDVLAERTLRRRRGRGGGHSASLLAAIHGIVAECGMRFEDLDLLVAGVGPGSFTGLRIGLACLKGLAFATSLPLAGISSLEALAAGTGAPGLVVPMFDARKQEVYAAAYRDGVAVLPDCAIGPDALAAKVHELAMPGEAVTLLGEGLASYGDRLEGLGRQLGPAFLSPRAAHLALLAQRITPDDVPALATLEPNYQRASDAERDLAKKKR